MRSWRWSRRFGVTMTNNLIGKRVRATLGENVLVGVLSKVGALDKSDWYDIDVGTPSITLWMSDGWDLEPLPDPLPTTPYSLVVPPADDPSSFPYVLLPTALNLVWYSGTTRGTESTVQEMIRDHGWRVIPGPAD